MDAFGAPQLAMWDRLGMSSDLLRWGEFDRYAKCNKCRVPIIRGGERTVGDAGGVRSDLKRWRTTGLMRCGAWVCPSCGLDRARDTASKLAVCFARHMARLLDDDDGHPLDPDVWMLTLTIPHYADQRASTVVDNLYDACARFLQSKPWKKFAKRWGLIGRVRVLDATHGRADGSHPHFHVALFPTRAGLSTMEAWILEQAAQHKPDPIAWQVDERGGELPNGVRVMPADLVDRDIWTSLRACPQSVRQAYLDQIKGGLVSAWEEAVRASGARIEKLTHFRETAVKLSPSEKASSYFTKWGLADEIGKPTAKDRGHLRLLDAAAAGVKGAGWIYKEWVRATHGKAWVTGLADVCDRLGVDDDAVQAWTDEMQRKRELKAVEDGTPIEKVRPLNVVFKAHLYEACMKIGWRRVFEQCDKIAAPYEAAIVSLRGEAVQKDFEAKVQAEVDAFLWLHLSDADRVVGDSS